jgi:SAM-dependent methyltransferase
VLDVGCGPKPYFPFCAPYASAYVGVDVKGVAELEGSAEEIPVPDGSFDLVVCTQVLEHTDDPRRAVRELRRVTAPGGRVLASTHGVQIYHPNPDDYWRWTHAGLAKLFAENGTWASLSVVPGSGTAACIGMLVNIYVDAALRRARLDPLARAFCAVVNTAAAALDARSERARTPGYSSLFANYHVVADVAA